MYRCYLYLVTFLSIMILAVPVRAENAADPVTIGTQSPDLGSTAEHEGFYLHLPEVTYKQLLGLIRTYQASLTQRKEEITRYLDRNRLDAKDALITAIMPGGLIYAAVRKGKLEQAKTELVQITEDMHELSRDLLIVQAEAGELKIAQLQ